VLQLMPNPALLLDARGRISHANAAAESLLRMQDGLMISRNGGLHLAAARPAETAALSRALAQALSVAAGGNDVITGPLRLSRPSGRAPLLVVPVPLPPPAFALWELVETARAMVLILDPEPRPHAAMKAMKDMLGLTGAEARVAALIAGGLSAPEAAKALGVSPATVKTHLARCFAKTDVHSQLGLARLLGTLLPDAPSLPGASDPDHLG
jgi:DNA-binding CsgD family transcriptional regulator